AWAAAGVELAIRGGGIGLVVPHHESAVAQTPAARGRPLARIWMHNGMLELPGEKMAKSVGNIRRLADVLDEYGGEALVLYFSGGHYRQPIAFSDERMQEAVRSVDRIREARRRLLKGEPSPPALRAHRDAVFEALPNDFNPPEALAALFNWVREANRSEEAVGDADLVEMLSVLGLESIVAADDEEAPAEAWELVDQRQAARKAKDFAEADRLRDE